MKTLPIAQPAAGLDPSAPRALRYDVDVATLSPRVRECFRALERDPETDRFIARAADQRHSFWRTKCHRVLRHFMSDFDANGLLDMYPLFVASSAQWLSLLGPSRARRLLDVGAGSGYVTRSLAPFAEHVVTTELSRHMAKRLRRGGFECHEVDLAAATLDLPKFDLVSCLNVLDRTAQPRRLLRRLCELLEPGGRLLIALALPYEPFYYRGATTPEPLERLACGERRWEAALNSLVEHELAPLGLSLLSVSRAPYLSFGDADRSLYVLDDAILLLQKPTPGGLRYD